MQILTCQKCRHSYLDLGNPKDSVRLAWFAEHGKDCAYPPLPEMPRSQMEAALRLLVSADTRVSH